VRHPRTGRGDGTRSEFMNLPLHRSGPGTHDNHSSARTAIESVYAAVREDILSGRLKPGSRLPIEHLRSHYVVGSSTVREALSRLVSDALVTTEGQRGFRVAPISLDDFREIAAMRKLLEAQALGEAIAKGDDDWEAGIVAAFHRLSKVEEQLPTDAVRLAADWELRNQAFHDALVAACGNRWLMHFRAILYAQSSRYLRISLTKRTVPRDVHAEHEALFQATLARDAELASRISDQHIELTVDVIAARMAQQGADDI
jgi:DNA-binding GntR family transcriptional regulator